MASKIGTPGDDNISGTPDRDSLFGRAGNGHLSGVITMSLPVTPGMTFCTAMPATTRSLAVSTTI
jgi:hypothetical protein